MEGLHWLAAVLFALCLPLASYVGAYFAMSETHSPVPTWPVLREFGSQSVCSFFAPMAWIESKVRRRSISLVDSVQSGQFREQSRFDP